MPAVLQSWQILVAAMAGWITRTRCGPATSSGSVRMASAKMNATLAPLTPDEIEDALRFVEICERGGGTSIEEADEWRRRILAWQALLGLESVRDN